MENIRINRLKFMAMNYIRRRNLWLCRRRKLLISITSSIQRRKKLFKLKLALTKMIFSESKKTRVRACRRFCRNVGWWETVQREYDDKRFKETFRLSRDTFNFILSKIRHDIEKCVVAEEPICPEMRLAICLYKLSRGDYYYTISEMTGIGESTVIAIVNEVCQSIINNLWKDSVENLFPKTEKDFNDSLNHMECEWQFKYAFCAIDGSHLPIKCPPGGAEAMKQYHNFKNFYSVILLALVDSQYRFIWASIGAPGNTHDSTLFQSTNLWQRITDGEVLSDYSFQRDNITIPPIILGDGAFPMRTWLLKPHGDAILPEKKRYFNYRLSRARMISEGAFGKLKGRWRVLFKKCESQKDSVKLIGLACVVLHNICIEKKDLITRNIDLSVDSAANKRRPSDEIRNILQMTNVNTRYFGENSTQARKVRDYITNEFWEEKVEFEQI